MENTKKSSFRQAAVIGLKLLLICAIVAGVVSLVYSVTKDTYEKNLENTKNEAVSEIFGIKGLTREDLGDGVSAVHNAEGQLIGFSVEAKSGGFGGDVEVMVGYDALTGEVIGVRVIAHSETPGLGAKAAEDSFLSQYKDQSGEIVLGEDVDAISGATISSKAVTAAVNTATETLKAVLEAKGGAIK